MSYALRIFPLLLVAAIVALQAPASTQAGVGVPPPQQKIVYHCSPGPGFDICSINPDGTGWVQLTEDSAEDSVPKISPDGATIVWERDVLELWLMNVDGSGKQQLLPDLIFNPDSPTWSPDGKKIAFICNDPQSLNTHGICTINRNGTGFEMVREIDPRPIYLEWSPDSRYMLVGIETVSINEDIFVWDMQTDQLTNLTNTGAEWEHGTWSPDGEQIAFVGTPLPSEPVSLAGLYVMNKDGTGRENLYTDPMSASATQPGWSPDGERIAFFCAFRDLCIVDPAGGLVDRLVEDFEDKYYLGNDPDWGYTGGVQGGDIDCTNGISPVDSLKLLRYDAGLPAETACAAIGDEVTIGGVTVAWGDIDCSGEINPVDSLKLLRYDAGLEVTQEANCPALGLVLA
ncbi:MAG: hypothetical protein WD904_05315 [Dehalococcoidia bacterium]